MRARLLAVASAALLLSTACISTKKGGAVQRNRTPDQSSLLAREGETFGRFVGVLHHDGLGKDQYAKLDFIPKRTVANVLEIRAVLSLYFGGFDTQEYVSYHFENVQYDLLNGGLVFNQSDQVVSLISSAFSAEGLTASVHAGARAIGTLTMNRVGAATDNAVVEEVAGDYAGTCDGQAAQMHLWTSRTPAEAARVGDPFGAYEITGSLGSTASDFCGQHAEKACVVDLLREASYDFFAGALRLTGKREQYECKVDGARLDCGRCSLQRVASASGRPPLPPAATSVLDLAATPVADPTQAAALPPTLSSSPSGTYVGYVHHERLDVYQKGALDLQTFRRIEGGRATLVMSATARLFFGDPATGPSLAYTFKEEAFPLLNRAFLLERMADDVDALVQITSLDDGVVRGVWFSQHYGRVGSFEFRKAGYAELPAAARPFQPLGGVYVTSALELDLRPRVAATPVNTLNPFFPIDFGGLFRFPESQSEWVQIENGTYDFYTGKIGLRTTAERQIIAGTYDAATGQLSAVKPSRAVATFQEAYAPAAFAKAAP